MAVVHKRIKPRIHDKNQIAALAAVPAVRTAVRDVQLSPEADMSVPAFAGTDKNARTVCKH